MSESNHYDHHKRHPDDGETMVHDPDLGLPVDSFPSGGPGIGDCGKVEKRRFFAKARALGFSAEECQRLQSLYFRHQPPLFR